MVVLIIAWWAAGTSMLDVEHIQSGTFDNLAECSAFAGRVHFEAAQAELGIYPVGYQCRVMNGGEEG